MVDDLEDYPEHKKLTAISDHSQVIGEFIEWLEEQGIVLAAYSKNNWYESLDLVTINKPTTQLLAEFFEIDLIKIEEEKRSILDLLHEANQERKK